jgi:hypothetical protein
MNPSEQDEMTAQNIRGWYEHHQGKVIKCTLCRKEEGCEEEFGRKYFYWCIIFHMMCTQHLLAMSCFSNVVIGILTPPVNIVPICSMCTMWPRSILF